MWVSQILLTKEIVIMEENSKMSHNLTSRKRPDFMLRAKAPHSFFLVVILVLSSTLIISLFLETSGKMSSKLLVLINVSSVETWK